MNLKEYLSIANISVTRFAASCEIPEATMNTYVNGRSEPSVSNALKIEEKTHGAVSCEDLVLEKSE